MSNVVLHPPSADGAAAVADAIGTVGFGAMSGVIPADMVARLRADVVAAVEEDAAWLDDPDGPEYGRVVFLPRYGGEVLELLADELLMLPGDLILGSSNLLYTVTTSCLVPGRPIRPPHVDTGVSIPGHIPLLGVVVALDDFDETSGATMLYPELRDTAPSEEEFDERCVRFVAPAGSVLWFHGNMWHGSLPNTGTSWRCAILLALMRPYMKQRFDVPRMLAHLDLDDLPERAAQKLGLMAQPPGSYEEFYRPPPLRTFRQPPV
jgi:ectoine hydroxylase-related dioxygenase (phytanoyl-CoA dioxygenase family)